MSADFPLGLIAGCNVAGATGLRTGASLGVSNTVRNGAGDYTVTLSPEIDSASALVLATSKTTARFVAADQISDSRVDVLTTDLAGVPTDTGFALGVFRLRAP